MQKQPVNHLMPFWLHTRMGSMCPAKFQTQYNCISVADFNPEMYAYARGKAPDLSAAVLCLSEIACVHVRYGFCSDVQDFDLDFAISRLVQPSDVFR